MEAAKPRNSGVASQGPSPPDSGALRRVQHQLWQHRQRRWPCRVPLTFSVPAGYGLEIYFPLTPPPAQGHWSGRAGLDHSAD